jgi:16S rRNA (adenine1518-N6/adenine1519-N6)-dimethyltransferase
MTRQRLGQHFLSSQSYRARISEELRSSGESLWIEIGAGHGEMTHELAQTGARVIAIETDPRLAGRLREQAPSWGHVEIVEGDVLQQDFSALAGGKPFRVYGNLPYYITSPILHHLFEYAAAIDSIFIVIQWEVAERIAARPRSRDYGYLSVACQFYARPKILFRIPPGAFSPPPKVASAFVRMDLPGEGSRLGIGKAAPFLEFVQTCFAMKRKTLNNNLRGIASPPKMAECLAACGLKPSARAEELEIADLAALYRALGAK